CRASFRGGNPTTSQSTHCAPSSAATPHSGLTRKIPTATAMTYKTRSRGSTFTLRFYQNFVSLVADLDLANTPQAILFQGFAGLIDPVELQNSAPVLAQHGLLAQIFPPRAVDRHFPAALARELHCPRLSVDQCGDDVAHRPRQPLLVSLIAGHADGFHL